MSVDFPFSIHFSPWDYTLSGANRSMLTLASELARRSLGAVFCLHDGEVAAEARRLHIPVTTAYRGHDIPRTRLGRSWRVLTAFRHAARTHKATILHCHSAAGMNRARYLARATGLLLVCHQRDNYAKDAFHAYVDSADGIITISDWVHSQLPATLRNKATVIHNAVLAADTRFACTTPASPTSAVRIGMAGRCVREKGFDIFLDAASRLNGRHVQIHVWGVDANPPDGSYAREILTQLAALPEDLRRGIHVQPFRPDVDDFFSRCDIVVVPSRFAEPFGRMAIEAMACGKTVVAAAHGGLPEIITDGRNGRLFTPGDAGALAEVLCQLIDNSAVRQRLAAIAASDVAARFSSSAHCDSVLRVYSTLSQRPSRFKCVLSRCLRTEMPRP